MIDSLMTSNLERSMDRFYGKYRGTVALNIDPERAANDDRSGLALDIVKQSGAKMQ